MTMINAIYTGIVIFIIALVFVSIPYNFYSVYYAYLKAKDERQKYIVMQSSAQTFTILFAYYVVDAIVVISNNAKISWLWELLHFGFDSTTPVFWMLLILGTCLFINKRRAGGA